MTGDVRLVGTHARKFWALGCFVHKISHPGRQIGNCLTPFHSRFTVYRVQLYGCFLFCGSIEMSDQSPPLSVVQNKDIRIVEFTSAKILDEANIAEIGATLTSIIDESEKPKLLLDFSNVDHLSSAALGMLINANNRIRQRNGQLRLTNIKGPILEVFVITKLNKLFRILPDRAEAMKSFNQ
jgi:anti-sigma B factor antagonist